MKKLLIALCVIFLSVILQVDSQQCSPRNQTAADFIGRPCRKQCIPGSTVRSRRCRAGRACVCDHECGFTCVNLQNFCPSPPPISNIATFRIVRLLSNGSFVEVQTHLLRYNDRIEYVCSPGYKSNLPFNHRYCHGRRGWTRAPKCVLTRVCGSTTFLADIPNAHLVETKQSIYTFGNTVRVKCNNWYELTSGLAEWRCSENAEWVPTATGSDASQIPVCSPICGIKNGDRNRTSERFAGKQPSNRNEWPWLVFIQVSVRPDVATSRSICVGAIISPDYILTAAVCVTNPTFRFSSNGVAFPNITHVWIGVHNRVEDRLGMTAARA